MDINNFYSKIKKTESCWEWTAQKVGRGYGKFKVGRKGVYAHRFSWEHFNKKKIPKNKFVLHSCDNPSCVNPSHLSVGTLKDNTNDMIIKGRVCAGTRRKNAKLTEKDVLEIREKYPSCGLSLNKLGKIYGVAASTIHKAINRKRWRHC